MEKEKILIDANRLKRRLERFEEFMVAFGNVEAAKATRAIIKGLKIMPTEDAVEVVRCKDCKKFEPIGIRPFLGVCHVWDTVVSETGYCHHGERRDDEADKGNQSAD